MADYVSVARWSLHSLNQRFYGHARASPRNASVLARSLKSQRCNRRLVARWVRAKTSPQLASCSITELGFLRVLAQAPAYGFTVSQARSLLLRLKESSTCPLAFIPDGHATALANLKARPSEENCAGYSSSRWAGSCAQSSRASVPQARGANLRMWNRQAASEDRKRIRGESTRCPLRRDPRSINLCGSCLRKQRGRYARQENSDVSFRQLRHSHTDVSELITESVSMPRDRRAHIEQFSAHNYR